MKEKISELFDKMDDLHNELRDLIQEEMDDSEDMHSAEGAMQDVKAHLRNAYANQSS
jgi:predicted  nucleic acid-binding Zn-ribbon protein